LNPSTEMLRTTYIKTNGTEFDEGARKFIDTVRDEDRIAGGGDLCLCGVRLVEVAKPCIIGSCVRTKMWS
jgi:hypothetical protein